MALKAEVGGFTVQADTPEELARLLRELGALPGPNAQGNGSVSVAPAAVLPASGAGRARRRAAPNKNVIPTKSRADALRKILASITNEHHLAALRYLADHEAGAVDTDLRKGTGSEKKMSGFTAAMINRASAYGLELDDLMAVRDLGIIAKRRVTKYQLSPEFLQLVREGRARDRIGGAGS